MPEAGATCKSCWDDLSAEIYCEYQAVENGEWLPSGYCQMCVLHLMGTQWGQYTSALAKTTCKAEQARLLERGPPINLRDASNLALPCPDGGEVFRLWFQGEGGGAERSAKLEGSLEGDARQKFWDEQLAFKFDEKDEGKEGGEAGAADPTGP